MNKIRLTIDDHRRLGAELKVMRDRLVKIKVLLGGAYPLNDRIVIVADRTWKELDQLRSELDTDVFNKYPLVPGSELMKIYYPGQNRSEDDHDR